MRAKYQVTTSLTLVLMVDLILLFVQDSTATRLRSKLCMPKFDSNRSTYASCLERPCLLFKHSPPLTKFDGNDPTPESQKPFPCHLRSSNYSGLSGVIFHMVDESPAVREDALCIFVGNECSYNDLTLIIGDAVAVGAYKFIAIDCLFRVSYRLTSFAIPSVPYMNDKVLIYGLKKNAPFVQGRSIWAALQALSPRSWTLVAALIFVLFLNRAWMMLEYRTAPVDKQNRFEWKKFFKYMLGEFEPVPDSKISQDSVDANKFTEDRDLEDPKPEKVEKQKRKTLLLMNWLWCMVTGAIIAISVLYYELGIVNFIFNNRTTMSKPLSNMTDEELREFAVVRGSATEYVFRLLADPNGRFADKVPLWSSFDTDKQIVEAIRDESHPAKYAFTLSQFAKYFLDSEKACDEFVIFEMRDRVLRLDASWFYSVHVPQNLRMAMDLRLNKLVEDGRIAEWIRGQVPSDEYPCGNAAGAIPIEAILGPILILLPFIGGMFIVLMKRRIDCILKRRYNRTKQ